MGCGKPTDEDNPFSPLKQSQVPAVTGQESEPSDSSHISHAMNTRAFMPLPSAPLLNSRFENAHGMHQSYTQDPRILSNVPVLIGPGTPQYVHSVPSPIDLRGNLSYQYTRPSGQNNLPSEINFLPNSSMVPEYYYRSAHVGEGQASVNHSQVTGSSPYLVSSTSLMQSTGATFANNDARVSASYPGNFDGSFLTLGIGGHNLSGSSSFQNNSAGLPGSMYNSSLGAMNPHTIQSSHVPEVCLQYDFLESSDRNLGIAGRPQGTYQGTGPYNHYGGNPASPFLSFSNANSSSFHSGLGRDSHLTSEFSRLPGTTFQTIQGQPPNYHARNSRDATSTFGFNPINVRGTPVTQDYLGKLIPALQDSMIQAIGGGSSRSGQPIGHQFSATGVSSSTPFRSTTFPSNVLPQTAEVTATVPGTVVSIPRRLGEQPDYTHQFVNRPMYPGVMGAQTRITGGVNQSQPLQMKCTCGMNQSQPLQITRNLHGAAAGAGYHQVTLPHQSNTQAPSLPSGPQSVSSKADQPSKMPKPVVQPSKMMPKPVVQPSKMIPEPVVQPSKMIPKPVVQPSKMKPKPIVQPSHKREAVAPPPAASSGQRRKLLHQAKAAAAAAASGSERRRTSATVLSPGLSQTPHIRWQAADSEIDRQPLGHKCFICNRDLYFTSEGSVSLPSMPPPAAVLHCGHTFHDHCLQRITPEDQANDPSCIFCAIGDNGDNDDDDDDDDDEESSED